MFNRFNTENHNYLSNMRKGIDKTNENAIHMEYNLNIFFDEIDDFIDKQVEYIKENVRGIENVTISVNCSDEIRLGNANSVAAIKAGATQVKTTLVGKASPKIGHFVNLISEKGEAIEVSIDIPRAEFNKT